MITKELVIKGVVQGVSYRAWMSQRASQLNVWGWVKNTTDGTVIALVHGPEEDVEQLILDCYKGPEMADVENIEIHDGEYDNSVGFEIRMA
jgi:acylphosphatase